MKLKQMCLVFAAALILSLAVCAAVFAETSGDFEYQINSDGTTAAITRYTGRDEALVIPPEIDGYIVTDLKISSGNPNVTSVSIPDSVTNITRSSITLLTNLAEITVSNGSEAYSSADGILYDKDMTRLIACPRKKSADTYVVPDSVKTISVQAFTNNSGIDAIVLPEGLQAIEDAAFVNCAAVVNIPSSVTEIGTGAFGRKKLREIVLSSDNKNFVISDNVLYSADMTRLLLYSDEKTDAELKLPETVASIDNYAFYGNRNLTSAYVPDSVTKLGTYAFLTCANLREARLPDSITVIPTATFNGCDLRYFEVGKNVTKIGNNAFEGCYELAISIPESVNEIGLRAFSTASNGTTTIYSVAGSYAETYASENNIPFADISTMPTPEPHGTATPEPPLPTGEADGWKYTENADGTITLNAYTLGSARKIEIPAELGGKTVTALEGQLFTDISSSLFLSDVTLPDTIKKIGTNAFRNCTNLSSINFPEGLTEIGAGAFISCNSLKSAPIPDSVTAIGENAFYGSGLTSVTIPKNVESLAASAFGSCRGLPSIDVAPENPNYESADGVLYTKGKTELLMYPYAKPDAEYTLPASVTAINDAALRFCPNIVSITIADGNQNFKAESGVLFSGDMTLLIKYPQSKTGASYKVPDSVTEIGSYAFIQNPNIKSVSGANVKKIDQQAFNSAAVETADFPEAIELETSAFAATKLKNLDGFDKLWTIGKSAFRGCAELTSIPAKQIGTVGEIAFAETGLTSINLNGIVEDIGANAFSNCRSLTSVKWSARVNAIPESAFEGCSALANIEIPENVVSVGANAFSGCGSLADVYYTGIEPRWKIIAIASGNEPLTKANVHFGEQLPETPPPATSTPEPTVAPTPTAKPTPTPIPKITPAPATATPEPPNDMPFKITGISGGSISMATSNDVEKGTPYTLIAAKYKDDILLDIAIEDKQTENDGGIGFTEKMSEMPAALREGEYIKVMVWSNADSCEPLAYPRTTTPLLKAFPGAEGGGQFAIGGRRNYATEIYHVTNLNDSGPGSLRDAVSKAGRIVVFDVGGTINLEKSIRYIGGVTILGQTAPGDGITITGANLELDGSNVIRYLRIRPTFKNKIEADGLGGYGDTRTIIDHCSVSYSIDECISFYEYTDFTLQNCISSESLKNGGHSKGAHGYGGIWGGTNASFHHNLLASHDSRNPRLAAGRLEGDIDYDMSEQTTLTDLRNNIIYNWGGNSAYGGQGAMAANIINSYYKPGPSTTSHRSRIFQTTSTGNGQTSKWATDLYVDGNYMDGNQSVTADNSKGVDHDSAAAKYYVWTKDNITDEAKAVHFKYENDYPVTTQTAEETYNTLLDHIGASLPRRDETDARIISEVRNGQGRIIDNEAEVGGVMQYEAVYRPFEIPQDWKDENDMGDVYDGDIVPSGKWKGYTWIEAYVNDWTERQENPTNPDVTASASASGNNIAVSAEASPVGNSPITKIVIYDGDKIISEHETDKVNVNIVSAEAGKHYISALAYNKKGESTRSTIAVVEVK